MKKVIIVIGLVWLCFPILLGQGFGIVAIGPNPPVGIATEGNTKYTFGITVDESTRSIINGHIKSSRLDKLFPILYKMLYENYKSQVCSEYSCKPMLLYIKYCLIYKNPKKKLYKKFIDFVHVQTFSEVEKIVNSGIKGVYNLNALLRIIMVNPYTKRINELLSIFLKEALENDFLRLIEVLAKYFYSLNVPARVQVKKYLRLARPIIYLSFNKRNNEKVIDKSGGFKMYEVFRTGTVFTRDDFCKDEKHNVDFANLVKVLQYPTESDPNMIHAQGQYCFAIRNGINLWNVTLNQACNNVSYFLYRDSKNIEKDVLGVDNVSYSIFYRFSKGYDSFNMLLQLPLPRITPFTDDRPANPNPILARVSGTEDYEWRKFSKVLFTENYLIYSGNTLNELSVCYLNDSILGSYEKFVAKYCIFFDRKQVNYEEYSVLDINFQEETRTLYALLAIDDGSFWRVTLHSFDIPTFSIKWKSDISSYSIPLQNQIGGGFSYRTLPSIPKHSIIFSLKGNVIVLSKNYFVSVERQTGMINFYIPLTTGQSKVRTSFFENLIIQKGGDKAIFMGVDTSILYKLDIERGLILSRIDLLDNNIGRTLTDTATTILIPGVIKNTLIYYNQVDQVYQSPGNSSNINAINLNEFKRDRNLSIPVNFISLFGQITFMDINCKYIFIGTSKGVFVFTRDWRIASDTQQNRGSDPSQISFLDKNGNTTSIVPSYMFAYKGFLFVFTRDNLYILSSGKKK